MAKIFISYRRADSQSATGRIYDHLVPAFGKDAVFIDVDNIPAGVDFRTALDQSIEQSTVMLVIIGPNWLNATDANGRRLDQVNDYVRIEIENALLRGMPLIPVLVEGARMPTAQDLPSTLTQLAYQNSREVQPNPHFEFDINRLIDGIAQVGVPRISEGEVVNPPHVVRPTSELTQADVQRNDTSIAGLIWGFVALAISALLGPLAIVAGIRAIRLGRKTLALAHATPVGQVDTRISRIIAMIAVGFGILAVCMGTLSTLVIIGVLIAQNSWRWSAATLPLSTLALVAA